MSQQRNLSTTITAQPMRPGWIRVYLLRGRIGDLCFRSSLILKS